MKKYITKNANETRLNKHFKFLLCIALPIFAVLLTGDLSCGKTTITKGIGQALGVTKIINSPTFTIVKCYKGKCPLYHLDLYRLNGLNQDFDLEEYIESDGVCVIEWPHQVDEILPKNYLNICLTRISEFERDIEISGVGRHYEEIVGDLK